MFTYYTVQNYSRHTIEKNTQAPGLAPQYTPMRIQVYFISKCCIEAKNYFNPKIYWQIRYILK